MAKNRTGQTKKTDMTEPAGDGIPPTSDADTPGADETGAASDTDAPSRDSEPEEPPEQARADPAQPPDAPRDATPPPEDTGDADETGSQPEAGAEDADHATGTATAGAMTTDETKEDARPAATAEPAAVVRTEQVTVRKGGFWSMLLGGIAAAGIGVVAAPHILPTMLPTVLPADQGALEERIAQRIAEQADRIAGLEEQVATLAPPVDRSDAIDGLSQTVTALAGRMADLEQRLADLAARPAPEPPSGGVPDEALAALRERLDAQRAETDGLRAEIDGLSGEIDVLRGEAEAQEQAARASARATLRRAALLRVMTALDSGEQFSGALAELRDTGIDVPEALAAVAETGAPSHAALVDGFAGAARAALAAARQESGEGAGSLGEFLRGQLGIRSLEPREGNDPDAILSRAEAALAEGRLGDALAEIAALPDGARAAMSGWTASAASRRDAVAAAEALSAAVN